MRSVRPNGRALAAALSAMVCSAAAGLAQDGSSCSGMSWPVETEVALMAAPGIVAMTSGASSETLPASAISLTLEPTKTVSMPVAPAIKPKAIGADTFSGWIAVGRLPGAGLYQISISQDAWIDVVQKGELIQSSGFTGKRECPTVRKSVRFPIEEGPVTVQLSGARLQQMKIIIRRAGAP